jgi:hypothetical protein
MIYHFNQHAVIDFFIKKINFAADFFYQLLNVWRFQNECQHVQYWMKYLEMALPTCLTAISQEKSQWNRAKSLCACYKIPKGGGWENCSTEDDKGLQIPESLLPLGSHTADS